MDDNISNTCLICDKLNDDNIIFNELSYCKSCFDIQTQQLLIYHNQRTNLFPEIDKITDKVYLGNEDASQDQKHLKSLNITNILICGKHLKQYHPTHFEYYQIEIADAVEQNISTYFKSVIDFIDKSEGHVFVHCAAGISRSASMVICYIMWKDKLGYHDAYNFVKSKRGSICPNSGFVKQLMESRNTGI